MAPIRILLVGSQRALAQSLAERLDAEPDMHVIGTAPSPPQARASISWVRAEVVLVDTDVGRDASLETTRSIASAAGAPRVVALAGEGGESDVVPLVLAGASGWVEKSAGVAELLAAIRGVTAGETWIPPRLLSAVVDGFRHTATAATSGSDALHVLTERERDVLACMVGGGSRSQIAAELVLSENTVRTHAQNVLRKLGVHSSLAAVALARRAGLPARTGEPAAADGGRS